MPDLKTSVFTYNMPLIVRFTQILKFIWTLFVSSYKNGIFFIHAMRIKFCVLHLVKVNNLLNYLLALIFSLRLLYKFFKICRVKEKPLKKSDELMCLAEIF